MENHFSRYSKLTLFVIVFILSVFLSLTTVYGQDFNRKGGLKAWLAQRGIDHTQFKERIREVIQVQNRHKEMLMDKSGVVGTATGITPEGEVVVKVFTSRAGIRGIPASLDGVGVRTKVTGKFYALQDPPPEPSPTDRWPRPAPIGVSTGHPDITAGTIGARVTDGTSIYALSNNHVYANVNNAFLGDDVIQPGTYDGGSLPNDFIGTLSDFEPLSFCQVFWIWLICPETNTIDAAIADVVDPGTLEPLVDTSTPSDGYGTPNSTIHAAYGDPDAIGDENLSLLLAQSVQKYGRTTRNTFGTIDAINATVDVCYDQACNLVAEFVNQIIITPGTFSAGGDSGSLIVTNDANKNPVGLLFAGSDTNTVANRIDLVLNRFDVTIDSGAPPSLETISVTPTSATIGIGETQQFTATGHYSDSSTEDLTLSVSWESSVPAVATIDPGGLATGVGEGTANITATHDGITSDPATLEVTVPQGIKIETGTVTAKTDGWTLVTLDNTYTDMVVVCTLNYDLSITAPTAVHIRNASGNSFEVRLVPVVYGLTGLEPPWSATVHWMVVESGVYTVENHGVKMEAAKFTSTVTDGKGSWVGQNRSYANSYNNPVVVGQVMTYNADRDYYWSVFWSRGTSTNNPPSNSALWVGKHKAQDPRYVNDETIGYIVIEAGDGTMSSTGGTVGYKAGLGSDSVRGMGNSPPYSYSLGSLSFTPSTAILSQAAMDGGDGSWAVLYGTNPVTPNWLYLAIEEDWVWDSERNHTTEQVGYIVFEAQP